MNSTTIHTFHKGDLARLTDHTRGGFWGTEHAVKAGELVIVHRPAGRYSWAVVEAVYYTPAGDLAYTGRKGEVPGTGLTDPWLPPRPPRRLFRW